MKSDFALILEECLAQMRSGKALEECLSEHPAQAESLRPLLETAAQVWEIPIPRARPAAVQAGRERLLAGVNTQVSTSHASSGRFIRYTKQLAGIITTFPLGNKHASLNLAFRMAALLVIILFATGGITVKASASSLPGDRLYPVKRTWESIRLSLTLNQQKKQQLLDRFAAERRGEVKALIQLGRGGTVEFQAPLEEMDAERWLVDGFQVNVGSKTAVEGQPETGLAVVIRAQLEPDGTLNALQVSVPGGVQSTPHPAILPAPSLTPQSGDDVESHPNQPAPKRTPQPTHGSDDNQDHATHQPSTPSEHEATTTQPTNQTLTPEPTDRHETQHTPRPTESHQLTQTPESTEVHSGTVEPTHTHEGTPEPTEGDHETPWPTEGH